MRVVDGEKNVQERPGDQDRHDRHRDAEKRHLGRCILDAQQIQGDATNAGDRRGDRQEQEQCIREIKIGGTLADTTRIGR